jgi:HprK-related kinase A
MGSPPATIGAAGARMVAVTLERNGLVLDFGAVVARIYADVRAVAAPLGAAYRNHPFSSDAAFADLHLHIERPSGLRRWMWPQAVFRCDGTAPFEPFPASHALPLLEWGANWLIGQRLNNLLLLHAGAVEKGGHALLMPALPGSGKSTLTAALSLRGWRLLSDEFGAYDPADDRFRALLKPVALKNASIDVIRQFAPESPIGEEFPKTRKGTVAHLAASPSAVARRHEAARPGAFVLPRWQAGSPTLLAPVPPESMFGALAFNAFNYRLLGVVGFDAVVSLTRRCPAWQLIYSDLDDAIRVIDAIWPDVIDAHASRANAVTGAGSDT